MTSHRTFRKGSKRSFAQVLSSALILFAALISVTEGSLGKSNVKRVKAGTEYAKHDEVHIVVNKVGPFYNPSETYRYYSLPFCERHVTHPDTGRFAEKMRETNPHPILTDSTLISLSTHKGDRKGGEKHHQRLGEKLTGNRKESSPYEITYGDDFKWRPLCEKALSVEDIQKFKDAIHNDWYFEMFVEDLPMWGYLGATRKEDVIIGAVEGSSTFLYPHLNFVFETNGRNIVKADAIVDRSFRIELKDEPIDVHYSYSVTWEKTSLLWKNRMSSYVDSQFDNNIQIHWFSIFNSLVLVLLLMGFLVLILVRIVKNDFLEVEEQDFSEDDTGWKLIHGDVFRFPQHICIFSSAIGTGLQLLLTAIFVLTLALTEFISTTRRGSILSCAVVTYCFLSIFGGYGSARLYCQMGGKNWSRNALCTAFLFPGPLFLIFCVANTIALMHRSTSALPFGAIVTVIAFYLFVSLPLTIVGSIVAKNGNPKFNAPTRTTKVSREIPTEIPWYSKGSVQLFLCATVPFSAIYIELNYIFASMWGHQIYTLFGILLLALLLLIIVTSFMTVTMLYFQLAREDHRWWWSSFINGGSTGIIMYTYSFIYFMFRTEMKGWLQASFFFGYTAAVSYACFLIMGSVAFCSSLSFVKFIFSRVKID